jgi:hypothetical protein
MPSAAKTQGATVMAQYNPLSVFELPQALVRPALAACRSFNTGLDSIFYNVPLLVRDLEARGRKIITDPESGVADTAGRLNLSAMSNPEGSLLVVSAQRAPFIQAFEDVEVFLDWHGRAGENIQTASITGVGSSALGSVALAWDISKALDCTVLAIVPGYGVADVVLQGLCGWIGFGLHDALGTKSHVQNMLALVAPQLAWLGRELVASVPDSKRSAVTDAPVFRTGCGSSDVLHALMEKMTITRVVGHSKGALAIANALRSLKPAQVKDLHIVTLGCPIAKEIKGAAYHQYLGLFDALGQANAWGHQPDSWLPTDHSTNAALPFSMNAQDLV